jgi:hypothetical protein
VLSIHPNPNQPREHFDEAMLGALADSIRERGLWQPVVVRPTSPDTSDSSPANGVGAQHKSPVIRRSQR